MDLDDAIYQAVSELEGKEFRLEDFCFPEQLSFVQDTSRLKTAVCSRRSGKTVGCAADLIDTARRFPGSTPLYITLKRTNAKRLVWPELLKINREYNLGGIPNIQELSLRFPAWGDSIIYCSGAKDSSEIDNFRGMALKKVYVDEAQAFRSYIADLIDDVLSKALFDYNGMLCLTGTPGPVESGYYYECATSKKWSHHAWTMFQNPWLEKKSGRNVMDLVIEDCERMGVGLEHPKIRRECYGEWATDPDSLVFKYDKVKNDRTAPGENDRVAGKWEYVIGVDLGHDDADAIAVIGWNPTVKEAYLIEEDLARKQGITELANKLDTLIGKYDPLKVVMDTGGLGKKIAEEIRRRRALPIAAAEKSRKFEFIELLNDAMRTSKFFAKSSSAFAQDTQLVEWERDKKSPDRLVVSDAYHSDICDAVLYAFRESLHWLSEPEKKKENPGTPEWLKEQEAQMEKMAEQGRDQESPDPWDDFYTM